MLNQNFQKHTKWQCEYVISSYLFFAFKADQELWMVFLSILLLFHAFFCRSPGIAFSRQKDLLQKNKPHQTKTYFTCRMITFRLLKSFWFSSTFYISFFYLSFILFLPHHLLGSLFKTTRVCVNVYTYTHTLSYMLSCALCLWK